MNSVLEARRAFRDQLPDNLSGAIEFYDPETYNMAACCNGEALT